jgi:hypothetical protein
MWGAIETGKDYRLTSYEEVKGGKFDMLIRNNLFSGSTEFMQAVFDRIGLSDIRLPRNSNRQSETITLGEAHNRVKSGEKLFIKPTKIKLFTGLVLDGSLYSELGGVPLDSEVMAYKPFDKNLVSEWRVYIHNNKIVDSRNYSGDFKISPDYKFVESVIVDNKLDFPVAYTIDVGIFSDGDMVVIEFNDMWAIGNYGMPNDLYLRLLTDRYFEIVRNG